MPSAHENFHLLRVALRAIGHQYGVRASMISWIGKAVALTLATASFSPLALSDESRTQLAGLPPDVGIAVATLQGGKTNVFSVGAAFNGDSAFEIGSITKTFTATLFADMILRGEVAADDPIEKYLPKGTRVPTFNGRSITLADLAEQESGLPLLPSNIAPANDPYVDYDDAMLLAFLSGYVLKRPPGAQYEYSNLGMGSLGDLLARRLGVDYATAIRTRILEPLGMTHTYVATAGHGDSTVPGHDSDGAAVVNWHFEALAGAGAIVSTPNDMLAYARANLDTTTGPLGAAMALAQRPRQAIDHQTWGSGSARIGYAWITDGDGFVWHNGATYGFRSFLGLDRTNHRAIFIVANAAVDSVFSIGFHALDPALPAPSAPLPDAAVAHSTLAGYVGRYRLADGPIVVVTLDSHGLVVACAKPAFTGRLHARSATTFALPSDLGSIEFAGEGGSMTLTVMLQGFPKDIGERVP
jgi:CubicO group peptidase (beta-lactamase class C family)